VSLSPNQQAGNIEAHIDGKENYWTYSLKYHKWEKQETVMLTDKEKEILVYSAQGMTEEQIAACIDPGIHAIKFRKQKLFKKLGVNKMSSAISIAFLKKMI
jgi:DNA-binding CsgD family transcriptional regulator